MVSICPLISKSFSLCTNTLVIVPRASITIGITVTLMFHSFFSYLARSWYLSLFSLSVNFTLWSAGTAESTIQEVLFFFTINRSVRLFEIWWSRLFLKISEVCVFYSLGQILGCAYTLCMVKFQFLAQWITLPIQLCLVLYSFCANLLHSLMW